MQSIDCIGCDSDAEDKEDEECEICVRWYFELERKERKKTVGAGLEFAFRLSFEHFLLITSGRRINWRKHSY